MARSVNRTRYGACALILVTGLAACGQGQSVDSEDPWSPEFERALLESTSDFEREVLNDGEVTRAEYDEAVGLYLECLRDQGLAIDAHADNNGIYSYSFVGSDTDFYDEIDFECRPGTIEIIEPLFIEVERNPANLPPLVRFTECLEGEGLIEAGTEPEEVERLLNEQDHSLPIDVDTDFEKIAVCL